MINYYKVTIRRPNLFGKERLLEDLWSRELLSTEQALWKKRMIKRNNGKWEEYNDPSIENYPPTSSTQTIKSPSIRGFKQDLMISHSGTVEIEEIPKEMVHMILFGL